MVLFLTRIYSLRDKDGTFDPVNILDRKVLRINYLQRRVLLFRLNSNLKNKRNGGGLRVGFSIWWFVFAVALLIAEVTLSGFVAVFFAIGAGVAGVLALFGVSLPVQIAVLAVVSIAGLVGGRKFLISRFQVNRDVIKTNVDAWIGREAVVTKKMTSFEKGRILCNSESWSAEGLGGVEIDVGEPVIIREIRGVTAIVERKKQ